MDIHLQHVVGWCPVCFAPILDNGRNDNMDEWEHATPVPGTPMGTVQAAVQEGS